MVKLRTSRSGGEVSGDIDFELSPFEAGAIATS